MRCISLSPLLKIYGVLAMHTRKIKLIITIVMISSIIMNEETFDERRGGLVCVNTINPSLR
jgi:hypothetical protein